MGSGSSKKKPAVQADAPKPSYQAEVPRASYQAEEIIPNQSWTRSSPLPVIPSAREKSPSLHSRASTKRRSSKIVNGSGRRSSVRPTSNKTISENDNFSLPPIDDQNQPPVSHASARKSPIRPPPRMDVSRSGSRSSSDSLSHTHRKHSTGTHGQAGRCSKCPHCRLLNSSNIVSTTSTPAPPWLLAEPGKDQVRIDMDRYDIEAVKEKIIAKNQHPLGSYDYQPYLTIETKKGDYDPTKENYYTQPFVAKTKPRITPLRTPFPDYDLLERRELRLNKPYSLPLFD